MFISLVVPLRQLAENTLSTVLSKTCNNRGKMWEGRKKKQTNLKIISYATITVIIVMMRTNTYRFVTHVRKQRIYIS